MKFLFVFKKWIEINNSLYNFSNFFFVNLKACFLVFGPLNDRPIYPVQLAT